MRKLHKTIGLILLLPIMGWAATGLVFLVKPGYAGAYERLQPRQYPLDRVVNLQPNGSWQDIRLLRTVLGYHLLTRTDAGIEHLDPFSLQSRPAPTNAEIRLLVADAISANSARYGEIVAIDGHRIATSTGVEISLDWDSLGLSQRGRDTGLINTLYRIHYLQWSPSDWLNTLLGALGIVLLASLAFIGAGLCGRPR